MKSVVKENRVLKYFKKLFLGYETTVKPHKIYNEFKENIYIETEDKETVGAFLLKPKTIDENTDFFIFCHGKGCDRSDVYKVGAFARLVSSYNVCFLLIDYRGFGDSTGKYTISGVNYDLLAGFDYIMKEYNAKSVNLVGHSLGCAIALEYGKFAVQNNKWIPKNIFCMAPFISTLEICKDFKYFYRIFTFLIPHLSRTIEKYFNYDNLNNARYVKDILYIFHGNQDSLINIKHGKKIAEEVSCKFYELRKNHLNIFIDEQLWDFIIKTANSQKL